MSPYYARLAEILRGLAADIERLPDDTPPVGSVTISMQATPFKPDVRTIVDEFAAILGVTPAEHAIRNGSIHYEAKRVTGSVEIACWGATVRGDYGEYGWACTPHKLLNCLDCGGR